MHEVGQIFCSLQNITLCFFSLKLQIYKKFMTI